MMRKFYFYIYFFISLILIGCFNNEVKEESEKTVKKFYHLMKNKNYDDAFKFYHQDFFKNLSKDKWLKIVIKINKDIGNIEDIKLDSWKIKKVIGSNSGIYVDFTYKIKYTKRLVIERLRLFKSSETKKIYIIGHNINLS